MSKHRTDKQENSNARVAIAGALTAGALLIAPVAVTVAAPAGIAHAAYGGGDPDGGDGGIGGEGPGGGTGPGTNPDNGPTNPGGGGENDPTGGNGENDPGTGPAAHKRIIRLPFVKVEIKNTRGDHKPPTIKFVPFPRLHR